MEESTSILIVDDAAVDARRAGGLLEHWTGLNMRYAADGQAALDAIADELPTLVLTDLQMPVLDGLQLVATVREKYPGVPVILMTAHGSEEVASEALRCGATGYVPKKHLARDLATTVRRVLKLVRPRRKYQPVLEVLRDTTYHFQLDNDTARIQPLIHYLGEDLLQMHLYDESTMMRVGVALDEAITNAIRHGNLEAGPHLREMSHDEYEAHLNHQRKTAPYADRHVNVNIHFTRDLGTFVIRDDGQGFDWRQLPDFHDPTTLERIDGRGLQLIHSFMDEVHFNDAGNEITMLKHADEPPCQTQTLSAQHTAD
ncbi:response regulator [Phycisphaerales bacterium AB-hyl4]|uniref:Response regulator n=1 Tax=Natronomicrosphaera hydrolytica TaxID=3242702 RepID=A0ABV4U2E5_9BACT